MVVESLIHYKVNLKRLYKPFFIYIQFMHSDQIISLSRLSSYFVIVPIIFGLISKINTNKDFIQIFYLLVFTLLIEIISTLLANRDINNIFVINSFTFFEFLFVVLFYKRFFDAFKKTHFHFILIALFLCLVIFTTFLANNIKLIDNFSVSIEAIILIVYALLAFFIIMKKMVYEDVLSTPFFWINSAVLIYFSGNLFLFIFSTYLQNHNESSVYLKLYIIHSILNILYYLILSIAFWKARKV